MHHHLPGLSLIVYKLLGDLHLHFLHLYNFVGEIVDGKSNGFIFYSQLPLPLPYTTVYLCRKCEETIGVVERRGGGGVYTVPSLSLLKTCVS